MRRPRSQVGNEAAWTIHPAPPVTCQRRAATVSHGGRSWGAFRQSHAPTSISLAVLHCGSSVTGATAADASLVSSGCGEAKRGDPQVSNGPTENLNLKIKNTKRIARGYRNFDHYRLRLLLNHGRIHEDHSPTRIRTRAPRFAA